MASRTGLDAGNTPYSVRGQAGSRGIEEAGQYADREQAIAGAKQYQNLHMGSRVWVWDTRDGRTIFQLEALDGPVSRKTYQEICGAKSVAEVRRAFRSGGVR